MKWPLVVTVVGVTVVIAAIVVNDAYSPDTAPISPPDLQSEAVEPAPGATGTPVSAAALDEKAKADAGPVFDLIRVAPDGHTVIAGQAEPGIRVVIFDGDTPLGDVNADARGEWVFLPPAPLQPGEHRLGLTAEAPDRPAVISQDLMVVVVPEPGEDLVGRTARLRDQPLAMKVSRNGLGPAMVLQGPREPGTALTLSIDAIDHDAAGRITFSGGAPADAVITVYVANKPAGQAIADASGRWMLRSGVVPSGSDVVRADQQDPSGTVVARVAVPFRSPSGAAMAATAGARAGMNNATAFIKVEAGQNLWRIARDIYGAGQAYTIIYEANRNDIQDPDLIYPGQVFKLPEL